MNPTAEPAEGHKIPRGYRYLNISTLWIPYYLLVIHAFTGSTSATKWQRPCRSAAGSLRRG